MDKNFWPLVITSCCIAVPLVVFAGQLDISSAIFTVGVSAIVFLIVYTLVEKTD